MLAEGLRDFGMKTIRSPFDGLRVPRGLVCEFFGTFSRFEFAIKEMGLFDQRFSHAAPDWWEFSAQKGRKAACSNAGLRSGSGDQLPE
jgi:hypothetical protein